MLDNRLIILLDADQLLSKTDLLDVEALRRATGEAQALRPPDAAPGEKTEPRGHGDRETEPRKKEGR